MHWMRYFENSHVFKDCLKLTMLMSRSRSSTDRELQTDGPATEKARRPYMLSRCRGTTGWWWLEDHRRCRAVHAAVRLVLGFSGRVCVCRVHSIFAVRGMWHIWPGACRRLSRYDASVVALFHRCVSQNVRFYQLLICVLAWEQFH